MDLKERLNRLTSVSKSQPEEKSQVLSDLRQRLDRLLEPKKTYRKKAIVPIEQLVKGEVISTPEGETFLTKQHFPPHYRYGEMALARHPDIPTYPAHLLSKDERLKELDFRKALFLDTETTGLTGGTGTFAFMVGLGFLPGGSVFGPPILHERLFRGEGFPLSAQRSDRFFSILSHLQRAAI